MTEGYSIQAGSDGIPGVGPQDTWYLIQCKPRQDQRAEEHLIRQGYECFLPVCDCERWVRGERRYHQEPLFPGYLFINLPEGANWSPLRSTRGVARIVSFGGRPLAVSAQLISQTKARAAEPTGQLKQFKAGDNVHIVGGWEGDFNAIFMAEDGMDRVILLIDMLNRQQQVSVSVSRIAAG
jgi:transcriptional antiterminator RfaH